MLAAQFVGKPVFDVSEVERPECPPGGLLVRVQACAICGTDLKIMQCQDVKMERGKATAMDIPRITGHEFSGVVEEVGEGVSGFAAGSRVVVAPTVPCMNCPMCKKSYYEMCDAVQVIGYHRDGGFAQFARVDEDVLAAGCVVEVPDSIDLGVAALTEPFSCAINCMELTPVKNGDTVLVMGAGPLGCFMVDLAHHKGAGQVILADISEVQLKKASVAEPSTTIDLSREDIYERIQDLTDGLAADLVITACPAPKAQQDALQVVAKRGSVNFFGGLPRDRSVVPLDTNLIHYKECIIVGTHGSAPKHIAEAVELQASGAINLGKYVDRRFPLSEINEALEIARGHGRMKILVEPN